MPRIDCGLGPHAQLVSGIRWRSILGPQGLVIGVHLELLDAVMAAASLRWLPATRAHACEASAICKLECRRRTTWVPMETSTTSHLDAMDRPQQFALFDGFGFTPLPHMVYGIA